MSLLPPPRGGSLGGSWSSISISIAPQLPGTLVSFWWDWSWLRTGKASREWGPSWKVLGFSTSE